MTTTIIAAGTAEELYAQCHAIDRATAEQLEELAESFAMSNNRDSAKELQALAAWKAGHAPQGPASLDWYVVNPGDPEALHYMMRPWHIVGIVLANEQRLLAALRALVPGDDALRGARDGLVARQQDHVAHLQARQAALPVPEAGWDDDPDPPFFDQ